MIGCHEKFELSAKLAPLTSLKGGSKFRLAGETHPQIAL